MLTASVAPAGTSAIIKISGSVEAKDSIAAYAFFREVIINDYEHVIVDLSDCRDMDSTFMGMLLVMHERFDQKHGSLCLTNPGRQNEDSLAQLGVTQIVPSKHLSLEGTPEAAQIDLTAFQNEEDRIEIMKIAHRALASANSRNAERFGSFLRLLDAETIGR